MAITIHDELLNMIDALTTNAETVAGTVYHDAIVSSLHDLEEEVRHVDGWHWRMEIWACLGEPRGPVDALLRDLALDMVDRTGWVETDYRLILDGLSSRYRLTEAGKAHAQTLLLTA